VQPIIELERADESLTADASECRDIFTSQYRKVGVMDARESARFDTYAFDEYEAAISAAHANIGAEDGPWDE
jgi:hypothetical protein